MGNLYAGLRGGQGLHQINTSDWTSSRIFSDYGGIITAVAAYPAYVAEQGRNGIFNAAGLVRAGHRGIFTALCKNGNNLFAGIAGSNGIHQFDIYTSPVAAADGGGNAAWTSVDPQTIDKSLLTQATCEMNGDGTNPVNFTLLEDIYNCVKISPAYTRGSYDLLAWTIKTGAIVLLSSTDLGDNLIKQLLTAALSSSFNFQMIRDGNDPGDPDIGILKDIEFGEVVCPVVRTSLGQVTAVTVGPDGFLFAAEFGRRGIIKVADWSIASLHLQEDLGLVTGLACDSVTGHLFATVAGENGFYDIDTSDWSFTRHCVDLGGLTCLDYVSA